jgi:hypothetical protein
MGSAVDATGVTGRVYCLDVTQRSRWTVKRVIRWARLAVIVVVVLFVALKIAEALLLS